MKLTKITLAALLATSFGAGAQAQDNRVDDRKAEESGAYGVIGGTLYSSESFGVEAKVGYNFNKYFGVEAQGSFGVNSDKDPLFDSPDAPTVTQDVDYSIGAFGVARLPVTERLDIFARAGVHNTQISTDISNIAMTNFNETETNYAVGGGAQFDFDQKNGVRAEYTYFGGLGGTVSLGYVRTF